MSELQDVSDGAAGLLRTLGVTEPFSLDAIPGGANNRVFRVSAAGRSYFLKSYGRHPDDPHARLQHDWSFARFAWNHGLRTVAEPLASDPERVLALFEFVPGRRLAPYDVGRAEVHAAAAFFRDLNRLRGEHDAAALPDGFGATFSVAARIDAVEALVDDLRTIAPSSPASEATLEFVRGALRPAWDRVRTSLEHAIPEADRAAVLPPESRCLSPVDFGFHNVLVRADGSLAFHDFEYAGHDDPARTACEFFCQLQSSAPREFAGEFLEAALADFADRAGILRRAAALWPVFRIQWCCRVLNDFLPASVTRQQYAGQPPSELRKTRQLEMARTLLDRPLDDVPWKH